MGARTGHIDENGFRILAGLRPGTWIRPEALAADSLSNSDRLRRNSNKTKFLFNS